MRRPRCLSCQERLWVDNAIGQLCIQHGVSDRDEDYRSTGWTAFLAAYRNFRPISSPDFWPYAYGQISAALVAEKRIRQDRVYKLLSLPARETLPTAFYFGIISAVCPGGCFSWHGAW